jgi:hypothetical protein
VFSPNALASSSTGAVNSHSSIPALVAFTPDNASVASSRSGSLFATGANTPLQINNYAQSPQTVLSKTSSIELPNILVLWLKTVPALIKESDMRRWIRKYNDPKIMRLRLLNIDALSVDVVEFIMALLALNSVL